MLFNHFEYECSNNVIFKQCESIREVLTTSEVYICGLVKIVDRI